MKNFLTTIFLLAALPLVPATRGDVIMFDFGPTSVSGNSLSNSPYHTANDSFTDTTWNRIQADTLSALEWSDGSAATGITVDLGGSSDATTLSLATVPTSSALGTQVNTGVYTNTSVGRDGIFVGTSGQSRQVGLQLGGLAAGLYEIYITGRNTSTGNSNSPTFRVGTSASAGNFNFTGYDAQMLTYPAGVTSATAAWVEAGGVGENYVIFSVSLAADEFINVAVSGSFGESRGFLNSMQIASVPEPSTLILMGGCFGALALNRRRRR